MKVTRKSPKVNAIFEFEVGNAKEAFDELAHLEEIFEQESCGNCKKTEFKLSKREVSKGNKTYIYREIVCKSCYHRLSLGQKQNDQSLFPQRSDKDGNPKPNFGWTKYQKDDDE